jgi:hypothetical protein
LYPVVPSSRTITRTICRGFRRAVCALACLLLLFGLPGYGQTPVGLLPVPRQQFLSASGVPLSGGCIWTYQSGTSTPLATYTDSTGQFQASNPVLLDSGGFASIYLSSSTYRIKAVSAGGVNCASGSQQWVVDGVTAASFLNMPNTWTALQTFNAGISTTTLGATGLASLANIDGFKIIDGTTYPATPVGLQQALTDAASTKGGVVIVPPGTTISGISTLNVGSTAAGTSALLYVAPGATLQTSINSSITDFIHLSQYSTLACGLTRSSSNGAIRGVSQAATTVRTVVSADQQNGNVEAIYVLGCQITDFTVSRAVIDGSATFNNTAIRDNIIFNVTGSATAPGILVASGTGATGAVGAGEITNNWVNPGTNTAGIILNGVDPGGLGSAPILGVKLWGNQIEHTGTAPMMLFTGNAANPVQNVQAIGNWFLPSSSVPNSYKIVDVVACQQCTFTGTSFLPVGVAANPLYGFYLESSVAGGVVDFHSLSPALNSFAQANFIHVHNDNAAQNKDNLALSDYIGISLSQGNRMARMQDETGRGTEFSSAFPGAGGNPMFGVWGNLGLANPGSSFGYNIFANVNPAANRNLTIAADPGGNDSFAFLAATQTLSNKTLTAPTLNGVTNGTGLQLFNTTTTCTTAATAGATCTTAAITLPVAYSDGSYRLSCTGVGPTNVPTMLGPTKSNGSFTLTIAAVTAAAASWNSFDCTVGHN